MSICIYNVNLILTNSRMDLNVLLTIMRGFLRGKTKGYENLTYNVVSDNLSIINNSKHMRNSYCKWYFYTKIKWLQPQRRKLFIKRNNWNSSRWLLWFSLDSLFSCRNNAFIGIKNKLLVIIDYDSFPSHGIQTPNL